LAAPVRNPGARHKTAFFKNPCDNIYQWFFLGGLPFVEWRVAVPEPKDISKNF
jgi:hypothetical protein